MVMPKSMVSLAVVSMVPSRCYSLYDGVCFPGDVQGLALWHAEAHCPDVTPVGEKFLKRDLIRRLRNDLVAFGVVMLGASWNIVDIGGKQ